MTSYVIGRNDSTVDINLDDEYVSNRHARMWRDDEGQVWIEDLGSTNGVQVNGKTVWVATRIYLGDVVRVGHTNIPVVIPGE